MRRSRCSSSVVRSVSTMGSSPWLSAVARPCPGMCLSTGRTPPASRPSATARATAATLSGVLAVGAVADDGIGTGDRHIGDRQTVDVDPDRHEIGGDQAGPEMRGPEPGRSVPVVDVAIGSAGRIGRPMRRPETLDSATLLIDQHGRIVPHRVTKRCCQTAHLRRSLHVTLEDNESPRLALAQEGALGWCQARAREPGDESAYRHRRPTSAPNPKFAHIARQVQSRTLGSKGALES